MDTNKKTLVLAGNPNVGKSVFFNALTGMYVDVSNFPGTTVDISKGNYKDFSVIDTPGVYGISSFNDEERVARDVIIHGDMILNVVDAAHLDRDLFLTQQLIDMGKPMIIALNMMDDVKRNGLSLDIELLEQKLGVKIIPTVATKKQGIQDVLDAIKDVRIGHPAPSIEAILDEHDSVCQSQAERLLVLEEDPAVTEKNKIKMDYTYRDEIYKMRRQYIGEIIESILTENQSKFTFKHKLSKLMLNPLSGFAILLITLFLMFQFLGVFIAQTVVGYTEEVLMGTYYYNFITHITNGLFTEGNFLHSLLIGEFGVFTMVPVYIMGLLLPLVLGFYFLLAILEDSGYLPRIATLVDKGMTKIGLNGRAIIPIILGFGCVTMSVISTRILGSKRERFIATMLLSLAIPCSAQLGVIILMTSKIGAGYFLLYLLVIVLIFILAGFLLNQLYPGKSTDLLIDIPPLRLPSIKNILSKTWTKSLHFLKEATPLFIFGAVLITVMQYFDILTAIQNISEPLVVHWLKLPKEVTSAFIMGLIRRDFGAAGLFSLAEQNLLSQAQTMISLIVITLFVPCLAAILVIFKERGFKEATIIWFSSFGIAFLIGGLLAQILI